MVAQTVPTSAWYIDKLTTVGTCSTSWGNEATRASGGSPGFHDNVTEAHSVEVPKERRVFGLCPTAGRLQSLHVHLTF